MKPYCHSDTDTANEPFFSDYPEHQAKIRIAVEQGHIALKDFNGVWALILFGLFPEINPDLGSWQVRSWGEGHSIHCDTEGEDG